MEEQSSSTAAPAQSTTHITAASDQRPNAMQLVWQWLCYSLWGLSLIALSVLLSATLTYYLVDKTSDYQFIIYTLATLICLLPLAWVADYLYSQREPDQKHGFAAVILVLHAVLVFLAALGGVIAAVVAILSIFVNPGGESTKEVVIISSLTVAVLGGLLFLRILNPARLRKFRKYFPYTILAITGVALVLTLIGPFRAQIAARNDKLIEDNLPTVNAAIQKYATDNRRLPTALGELDLSASSQTDAKRLADDKLVDYRVVQQVSSLVLGQTGGTSFTTKYPTSAQERGLYELCVTYTHAKNDASLSAPEPLGQAQYSTYLSTYNHRAGRQCYTLEADVY